MNELTEQLKLSRIPDEEIGERIKAVVYLIVHVYCFAYVCGQTFKNIITTPLTTLKKEWHALFPAQKKWMQPLYSDAPTKTKPQSSSLLSEKALTVVNSSGTSLSVSTSSPLVVASRKFLDLNLLDLNKMDNNKFSTPDLLHSIYKNAEHNLRNNQPETVQQSTEIANGYIARFKSSFTRDLLNAGDLDDVMDDLVEMLIEQEYLTKVAEAYLDICQTIKDVEAEELLEEITADVDTETTTRK